MTTLEKLVLAEAKALKKHATNEEISNLTFGRLNPDSKFDCVYGQMTGNCFSERAKDLIEKSCKRVYATNGNLESDENKLNGSPVGKIRDTSGGRNFGSKTTYWSPIELYIYGAELHEKKELISFLKGETKTLF